MHAIGLKSHKSHNGAPASSKDSSSTIPSNEAESSTTANSAPLKRAHSLSLSASFKNLFTKPKNEDAKLRQEIDTSKLDQSTSSLPTSPSSLPQNPLESPKITIPPAVATTPVSAEFNLKPITSRTKKPSLPVFAEEGSENSLNELITAIPKPQDAYVPTPTEPRGRSKDQILTQDVRSRSQSKVKLDNNQIPSPTMNQPNSLIGTIRLYENGQHEHVLKPRKVLEKIPTSTGILSGFLKKSSTSIKNEVAFSLLPENHRSDFQRRLSIQSSKIEDDSDDSEGSSSDDESDQESDDENEESSGTAVIGDAQLKLINRLVEQINNEEDPSITSRNYKLSDKYGKPQGIIGKGAYGLVKLVSKTDSATKKEISYAVKELKKKDKEDSNHFSTRLTSEFVISNALNHINIVKTLDLMKSSTGAYCEIMEYCSAGDLYSLVLSTNGEGLHYTEADCFMRQILRGLSYMHSKGVAHCDIKPENILLTTAGVAKISDFGTSAVFRTAWEKECHFNSGACGSEPYVAPEEFIVKEYDPRCADVWSLGVVYLTMNTGGYVWEIAKNSDDLFLDYLERRPKMEGKIGKFEPIECLKSGFYYKNRKSILYSMLDPNPKTRVTTRDVLRSAWIKNTVLCEAAQLDFHD